MPGDNTESLGHRMPKKRGMRKTTCCKTETRPTAYCHVHTATSSSLPAWAHQLVQNTPTKLRLQKKKMVIFDRYVKD